MNKTIVVSAVALYEGGPLTVLQECLAALSKTLPVSYRIIALVHDVKRLPKEQRIEYREYRHARTSWFHRLYYEYVHFFFLSHRLKPDLWISLHDITPNVTAKVRVVYCHNPSLFMPFSFQLLRESPKLAIFSLFYKYLYNINIRKNNFVIVQQEWIRTLFEQMYGINNIVVAYPTVQITAVPSYLEKSIVKSVFFYPAFPRVFKNIEVVAEAAKLLYARGREDFSLILTISGDENAYAHRIFSKYNVIPTISFIGIQSRDDVFRLYSLASALVFSSKLETWGLPITEFKAYRKPMLLSDLPYAHETLGDYQLVKFFSPDDPEQLASCMEQLIDGTLVFDGNRCLPVRKPFARDWKELLDILSGEMNASSESALNIKKGRCVHE